jgi:hypothetical protein
MLYVSFFLFYLFSLLTFASHYSCMVVQTVWLLPDGNVDSRRICLLVVFSEGVMKSMRSLNSSAIRTCLMAPGEFIAMQLGAIQGHGRILPWYRLPTHRRRSDEGVAVSCLQSYTKAQFLESCSCFWLFCQNVPSLPRSRHLLLNLLHPLFTVRLRNKFLQYLCQPWSLCKRVCVCL